MKGTEKILETMYSKLDSFLKTETVVGEAIEIDDIKIIPIITASFGLGGGFGADSSDQSEGGGGGLGCKIEPDAMLVIKDGKVEMIPVKKKSASLEKLIEKVPDLITKLEKMKDKKEEDDESEE
ncbi:MAG: spore germination protein GerW family protein [Candidatus Izemoplasmatales bacterium]